MGFLEILRRLTAGMIFTPDMKEFFPILHDHNAIKSADLCFAVLGGCQLAFGMILHQFARQAGGNLIDPLQAKDGRGEDDADRASEGRGDRGKSVKE